MKLLLGDFISVIKCEIAPIDGEVFVKAVYNETPAVLKSDPTSSPLELPSAQLGVV